MSNNIPGMDFIFYNPGNVMIGSFFLKNTIFQYVGSVCIMNYVSLYLSPII